MWARVAMVPPQFFLKTMVHIHMASFFFKLWSPKKNSWAPLVNNGEDSSLWVYTFLWLNQFNFEVLDTQYRPFGCT